MIIEDRNDLWEKLKDMTEEERIATLDPICETVQKATEPMVKDLRVRALPNRIFALAVLELYEKWNREILERA